MEPTYDLVSHGEATIEVIRQGSGPLIVLLPSLGRDSEEFDPIAAEIAAAGFRVIRPRPRGFGRSAGPMAGLTIHDFAGDVAAAIGAEGAGAAIIVGHAYGHVVARMTAVDFPDLVRAVVLLGASQKNLDPEHRRLVRVATDPAQPDGERLEALRRMFFAPGHDARVWLEGFDAAVQRSQFDAYAATPIEAYWQAGTAPLFDLRAGLDPSRPPSTANELVEEYGADRVTTGAIEDASHALIVEQPAAIAAAVVAYARRLDDG
jgi:pimeloyl-ACP methyl ester carboxylesterase